MTEVVGLWLKLSGKFGGELQFGWPVLGNWERRQMVGSTRTTCCHNAVTGGNCERGERQLSGTDENSNNRP